MEQTELINLSFSSYLNHLRNCCSPKQLYSKGNSREFIFIPVVGVPIAAEYGAIVGGEHAFVAVGTPDVPQLDVSILKGGGKGEIILHAELNVSDTL